LSPQGQVGWNERGEFADGLVGQVAQTLANVASVLKAGGAGPEHLVRLTWYVTDVADYRARQGEIGRSIATSSAGIIPPWRWWK
jgi:enamine deaminase RidA (YjgF/YER057c/UK114 family)